MPMNIAMLRRTCSTRPWLKSGSELGAASYFAYLL